MEYSANAKNNSATGLLIILGILIFSYTVIRAFLLAITWDEAYTYLEFVRNGKFIPDKFDQMSANNHLLNTWLDIFFVKCFGVNEFVLRLPSLFGHLLFLFYSAKLVTNFENKGIIFCSFFILNVNPYMLDYFSLSRGYGLSWGLMMTSVYYLFLFQSKGYRNLFAITSIAIAALATLANFVLLNYCLALYGFITILICYKYFNSEGARSNKIFVIIKELLVPSIIIILFLGIIVPFLFHFKQAGTLFWGGQKSFWTDSISETINRNLYELKFNLFIHWLLKAFMLFVVLAGCIFIGHKYFKTRATIDNLFVAALITLIGFIVLSTTLQYYLIDTPYLTDRTAMFIVILFNLLFVVLINEFSKEKPKAVFLIYSAAGLLFFHFAYSSNLKYVLDWKFDADTKGVIAELENQRPLNELKSNQTIGTHYLYSPSLDFYRATNKIDWITCDIFDDSTISKYDYIYLSLADFERINNGNLTEIKIFPITKSILAKVNF